MSYEREEKTREVEDAPKQPSQDIAHGLGGAEVSETTAFDRIVASARQEAEVDVDLVPSSGGVSAAPKVSKTGVEESAEAIGASLFLVAARMDAMRAGMASERLNVDEARGALVQRDAVEAVFTRGVASLELDKVKYQLVQYKDRLVDTKSSVGTPVRVGLGRVERAALDVHTEAQECRKRFGTIDLDDAKLVAKINSLDESLGIKVSRAKAAPAQSVAKAVRDAFSEQAEAIQTNAAAITSAASVSQWSADKSNVLLAIASHTQAIVTLDPGSKSHLKRARSVLRTLDNMIKALGTREETPTGLSQVTSMTSALRSVMP